MKTTTSNEVHRALTFKSKEPETISWINRFENSEGEAVFYDIGANVGIYSLYAASRYPEMRVLSFEPEAQSFAALCTNFATNKFHNAVPYQLAMSDHEGFADLFVGSMNAGAGAAALGNTYAGIPIRPEKSHFKQGVYQCSLDRLVGSHGFPTPTFVKIDVDGIEARILLGGRTVLSDPRLKGLLVEFQYKVVDDLKDVFDMLEACGLILTERSSWQESFGEGLQSQNFIFERKRASQ